MTVQEQGRRAREAATVLATASRADKDAALLAMADALIARTPEILEANADDVGAARTASTPDHIVDRLRLDAGRVAGMGDGLRQVAGLPDPVDLVDAAGNPVARGLVNYDAAELPDLLGRSTVELGAALGPAYEKEVVHRDDLVLL